MYSICTRFAIIKEATGYSASVPVAPLLNPSIDIERKKVPNLGLNSWSSLPGSYPLTIRQFISYYIEVKKKK